MEINFNNTSLLLNKHDKQFLKRNISYRLAWGKNVRENLKTLKNGFIYANSDRLNDINYNETEEIKNLASWMIDTKGNGLALIGASGRGKTLFLHGVLPHLLIAHNKVPHCIKATDLSNKNYGKILLIDEVGREDMVFDKERGKIDRFPEYVDYCADNNRPLFFTSNITAGQFKDRYGEHIYNRVTSICKMIIYNGKSMW